MDETEPRPRLTGVRRRVGAVAVGPWKVSRFRRTLSIVVTVALAAAVVATVGSPAQAVLPYCNAISTVVATDGTGILYPTYRSPWRNGAAPTLSCDMAGYNENPTSEQKQAIVQIQKTLKTCYKKAIAIDGLYGPGTKQAVTEVQQTLGLTADGWAGPNTRTAMKHILQGSSTSCKNRSSSGALSSNQYLWYMRYMRVNSSYPDSQPLQVFEGPQPTPPTRTNSLNKPIYFVHGYDPGPDFLGFPTTASGYWGAMIDDFVHDGSPAPLTAAAVTFCYYSKISGCTVNIGGDVHDHIKEIAKELAWEIYMRHSKRGLAVDIVSHSMGGLVARAAITGTTNGESGFPPYIYVEDAVTIVTPNAGVNGTTAAFCLTAGTAQCADMLSGSAFMAWVDPAPWSGIITDWTYIGTEDDPVVFPSTSVPDSLWVEHKVLYDAGQILPIQYAHNGVLNRTSGAYNYKWCDLNTNRSVDPYCRDKSSSAWVHTIGGSDPSRMARLSVYYKDLY